MVVERNSFRKLIAGLLSLAEAEVGVPERGVSCDVLRVNRGRVGQLGNCFAEVLAHEGFVPFFVVRSGFSRRFKVELRNGVGPRSKRALVTRIHDGPQALTSVPDEAGNVPGSEPAHRSQMERTLLCHRDCAKTANAEKNEAEVQGAKRNRRLIGDASRTNPIRKKERDLGSTALT